MAKNPEQKADAWTDKELAEIEKQLAEQYKKASEDLDKEWQQYLKGWDEIVDGEKIHHAGLYERYEKEYKAYQEGKYTKEQFERWYESQVGRGNRWKDMRDQMAKRMTESNEIASRYINGKLPGVYVRNNNAVADIAQQSAMEQGATGVRFDQVDESTVRHLITEKSNTISFRTTRVNPKRDYDWNAKRIQNALTQGILQGDSIGDLSKRFLEVMGSNEKAAVRNARTAVTSARNAGKQDRYDDLSEQGCEITKIWDALLDDKVRDSHRKADGQEVPYNEPFLIEVEEDGETEKMMYPGDPEASPQNVYNCRCSMHTGKITFKSVLTAEQREKANIRIIGENKPIFQHDRATIDYRADKVTFKDLQQWKKSIGNVTDEEYEIIGGVNNNSYIRSSNSYKINKALREGTSDSLSEKNKITLKTLETVIDRNISEMDAVLVRNVDGKYLENVFGLDTDDLKKSAESINSNSIGKIITEKGFVSTSYKGEKNLNKNDKIILDIYAPEGTKMFLTKNREESEIILQHNTDFEIEGAIVEDGKIRILMKVVNKRR